jgi:hypothetical protein
MKYSASVNNSQLNRHNSFPWRLVVLDPHITNSSGSESYITTDRHSPSLSWNKAPIWCLRPDFYYCQTLACLLKWGALSDERTGLSFTLYAGPRQRSHSRVRVPWDWRPYFTVSHSRLYFLLPPTTRRAMMEVFDPPPHGILLLLLRCAG